MGLFAWGIGSTLINVAVFITACTWLSGESPAAPAVMFGGAAAQGATHALRCGHAGWLAASPAQLRATRGEGKQRLYCSCCSAPTCPCALALVRPASLSPSTSLLLLLLLFYCPRPEEHQGGG